MSARVACCWWIAITAGCDDPAKAKGSAPRAGDYAGREGTVYGYAVAQDSVEPLVLLAITPGAWEFRSGNEWDAAVAVATYVATVEAALVVDGVELLPESFEAGESSAGIYGEYADTATHAVSEGTFAGTWIFARDLGPVYVALTGVEYQLVTYQDGLLDTGG